jgi:hypothetical protein
MEQLEHRLALWHREAASRGPLAHLAPEAIRGIEAEIVEERRRRAEQLALWRKSADR